MKILQQAQEMQGKLQQVQEELAQRTVTASSGGGMVSVEADGQGGIRSIKIDRGIVNPADVEMLEDLVLVAVTEAQKKAKAGKVKFIAVGAGKRMALLPEVPTVADSGLPGYEAVSWFGLFGPPGMPADIVTKINAEVRKIFDDPEIKKSFLERQYFESIAGTPEQLTNYIKADEPKWRKVIQDAKVKGE